MSKQMVLLRVGVDSGCGGIQGPLFADGTFDFVCIPDNKGTALETYGTILGRDHRPHVEYFPKSKHKSMTNQSVHIDPEWATFTYGDPTPPKCSLRKLEQGDWLVFYCGLQRWDATEGFDKQHRPALYLAGYFVVESAGLAKNMDDQLVQNTFANNFHVRHPAVYKDQRDRLVLVKGGSGSRLFRKAHQISTVGKDKAGTDLKILSPEMEKVFGVFGGLNSLQRSPPRWVEPDCVERAKAYLLNLE
jgi:hypothetical protein